MSNPQRNPARKKDRRLGRPISLLSVGAALLSTLTACATETAPNASQPAPTFVPQPVRATEPAPAPTASTVPTQAPTAAPEPTAPPTEAVAPTVVPTTAPEPTQLPTAAPTAAPVITGKFKDGEFLGESVSADRWGDLQVKAIVEGGRLVKIDFVKYPQSTRRSISISNASLPKLVNEAIENQDAQVDVVSRATDTVIAFRASLDSALQAATP